MPLFVSRRRLEGRKSFPRARCGWALDSGGFTELSQYGEWRTSVPEYIALVRRFGDEIGNLEWAAPMDWMCEPQMLARTGFTVKHHQAFTIDNYLDLRSRAPELPISPVLQGWELRDYLDHVEQYARRGIDLTQEPVVGVGTVCRRQHTAEAEGIMRHLALEGLNLHGFGFKVSGLAACADVMVSADSMAWSYRDRRSAPLAGCSHKNCANCPRYAVKWREGVLRAAAAPKQPWLAFRMNYRTALETYETPRAERSERAI